MQRTADFHEQIADARLPQAVGIMDDAAAAAWACLRHHLSIAGLQRRTMTHIRTPVVVDAPHHQTGLTTARNLPTISPMDRKEAVSTIAQQLGETEAEPLKRLKGVVKVLGVEEALALCEQALQVEREGGMLTKDGSRRRTVGGIFFYLARATGNPKVLKLWPRWSTKKLAQPQTTPAGEAQRQPQQPHTPQGTPGH